MSKPQLPPTAYFYKRAMARSAEIKENFDPPANADACEICLGRNGGEPGNENIVNGVIMCDDCSAADRNPKKCDGCGRQGGIVDVLSRRKTYNVVLETVTDCGVGKLLCQWCRGKRNR